MAVVLFMVLTRPSSTDLIDESGAESDDTAEAPQSDAALSKPAGVTETVAEDEVVEDSGISAKLGERPAAEEGTSSAPLSPSEAAVDSSPVGIVRPPGEAYNTLEVNSVASWNNAVRNAQPGDTIMLTATINAPLSFKGPQATDGRGVGRDGTAERPITITAAPDVWIDPGNQRNNLPALDLFGATHVHINGVSVRNSQFGIRVQRGTGAEGAPIIIANNTVTDTGHAGIHVGGAYNNHTAVSSYVRVEANRVTRTGRTAPQFGEGIYLGYGGREWIDHSNNLWVINNQISETTAEGVDIKPGTKNVVVDGNQIYDLAPISGGAISAHYVNELPNPTPATNSNIMVSNNRIWNVNLSGTSGANDWAIWVGHGGVTIENNAIWGMRNTGNTRAIRVRGLADFGPHPVTIRDNVFWTATGWVAEGSPRAQNIQASGNQGPNGASGVEVSMQADAGAPALGTGGLADNGDGPGSALGFNYETPTMPDAATANSGSATLPGAGQEGQTPQFGS